MQRIPVKLGPFALLLTVITICLTTLSILTLSTAGADLRLAERYADTARIRYELEAEGQAFLRDASAAIGRGESLQAISGESASGAASDASGASDASDAASDASESGTVLREFHRDGYTLTVGLREENGSLTISTWKLQKDWEQEETIGGLWNGL